MKQTSLCILACSFLRLSTKQRSNRLYHEAREELAKFIEAIEQEHKRDVLVRPHQRHGRYPTTPQVEDILIGTQRWGVSLLIVLKAESALMWFKNIVHVSAFHFETGLLNSVMHHLNAVEALLCQRLLAAIGQNTHASENTFITERESVDNFTTLHGI